MEKYVFNIAAGQDNGIRKEITIGERINTITGLKMYLFRGFELPAYAVADTEEEAKAKYEKFSEFRDKLNAVMDEATALTEEFEKEYRKPEVLEAIAKLNAEKCAAPVVANE